MSFDLIDFKGITSDVPGTWVCLGIFRPTQISDPNNKIFFPRNKTPTFFAKFSFIYDSFYSCAIWCNYLQNCPTEGKVPKNVKFPLILSQNHKNANNFLKNASNEKRFDTFSYLMGTQTFINHLVRNSKLNDHIMPGFLRYKLLREVGPSCPSAQAIYLW